MKLQKKIFCSISLQWFLFILCGTVDVKLGGLFYEPEEEGSFNLQKMAFNHAVFMSNERIANSSLRIDPKIEKYFEKRNSFLTQITVCKLLDEGLAGVFGPQLGDSSPIVQSICDSKEIPHVQTRWDPKQRISSCLVSLYPHANTLSQLYSTVVRHWNWKKFTIIYEDNNSLIRIGSLLKPKYNGGATVKLRQLQETSEGNFRPMLMSIKESEHSNIVLDCSIELLPVVLQQSQQVGLISSDHNFIITNLDLHTLDLEQYQYTKSNITGFRMVDVTRTDIGNIVEGLSRLNYEDIHKNISVNQLTLGAALMYDAVELYVRALSAVAEGIEMEVYPTPCNSSETWKFGYSIINYMKVSVLQGLTGIVKFDHEGFRTNFDIEIVKLTEDGIEGIGKWNKSQGITLLDQNDTDSTSDLIRDLRNVTLTVILSLTKPYGMRKKSATNLQGNDQYEGYCVDLISALSSMSGFKYKLTVQEDGQSGNPIFTYPNKTRKWSGMIGAVLENRADLAIADITITRDREKDVDFTPPFMDLGIAVLYLKPTSAAAGWFSFLSPFSVGVWYCLVTAYLAVSLIFFIMGRISPYEWRNPYPCVQEPEVLENQFTLSNSFWFTTGAMMQQGSDIAPISVSTRMAAGFWWFFTLIMVSSYTANLAAFLALENPTRPFKSVEDLASQNEIKYGAKENGATYSYFKESTNKVHKRMYNYMNANPDVMTKSSPDGVKRVLTDKPNYAFLMESTSIEYEVERECELSQVGEKLGTKGYGIAMRRGSWYLSTLSQHVLLLQERGKLATLKRKWWQEKYAGSCGESEAEGAETLDIQNVLGVFIVLAAGVAISFLVAIFELLMESWAKSKEQNRSFKEYLKKELRFILRFHGSTKILTGRDDDMSEQENAFVY